MMDNIPNNMENEAVTVQLRPVDRENWRQCVDLSVSISQEHFIAENWYSLLEWKFEEEMYPYCIYANETVVGFLMYGLDQESRRWGIWRFMVDARYQHKGYGKEALGLILEIARERLGESSFYTTADAENVAVITMYRNAGFEKTDEVMWDEDVYRIGL